MTRETAMCHDCIDWSDQLYIQSKYRYGNNLLLQEYSANLESQIKYINIVNVKLACAGAYTESLGALADIDIYSFHCAEQLLGNIIRLQPSLNERLIELFRISQNSL